ncbi:MAG TPA: hypothetical protein VF746_12865 [Longimicrobium sp.]|jgi:tetratricopeptide (TPR) repeat protein
MRALILGLALTAAAHPLAAQRVRVHDVPPRPALFASADTNSAATYYIWGSQNLERDPARAAAAFYWAYRLNPRWADALYARRVALHLADPSRLVRYMDRVRGTVRNPEVMAIDSLHLRALTIDPFLVGKFDRILITQWLIHSVNQEMSRGGGSGNMALAHHVVQTWLMDSRADPYMRAWYAYSEGRYPAAIEQYERELRRARRDEKARWRTDLGRLHFLSGNNDRSLEHFAAAIQEMRAEDQRDVVFVYESKALLEQSIGAVHEKAGNTAAAREAYGRALTEDLSYYPAHQRLAWLALAAGDTAAAVSEMALAAEVAKDDGVVQYEHGLILAMAGKAQEADAALKRAVAVEPYFAEPYLALARLHDASGLPEALEHYRAFLAHATRDHPQRPAAEARVSALAAAR